MAYSLYGAFGTKFRANTPLQPDSTFITTNWFALFFIPIIPLGSYRVKYLGNTSEFYFVGFSLTSQYQIIQKLPLDIRGIVKFYLYLLLIIVLMIVINIMIK